LRTVGLARYFFAGEVYPAKRLRNNSRTLLSFRLSDNNPFKGMSMKQFPEPLGSVFLTGLDGFIYELPEALARQHRVSPERIKELGHLPIAPYPGMVAPASADDEVSARHYVLRDDSQFGPHTDLLYGTAVSEDDGICYTGLHFHPTGGFAARFLRDSRTGAHSI
jgi:hypothetical protein